MKINSFVTDNCITLYWDKPEEAGEDTVYEIYVDGKKAGESVKTHFTLEGLDAAKSYCVKVSTDFAEAVLTITTASAKRKIDVTRKPYLASGDGSTLNTEVLQQAIADCTAEDVLYFPAGVYMTGALRLHSDMEIYLEEGAVLQGTDRPEDYLPRIWSRLRF